MGELIAFANTHPILASLVVVFLIATLSYEVRLRGKALIQVSTNMAVGLINRGALVVDVRPKEAYSAGHIVNARNITVDEIVREPGVIKKKKDKLVLTVCDTGQTSKRAADALRKAGYESAFSLQGGLTAWRNDNLPLVRG